VIIFECGCKPTERSLLPTERWLNDGIYAQDGNVAVSDYDNKWISIHEPGGKFLSKIGSNKVKSEIKKKT
jgi:hypothetical protein